MSIGKIVKHDTYIPISAGAWYWEAKASGKGHEMLIEVMAVATILNQKTACTNTTVLPR